MIGHGRGPFSEGRQVWTGRAPVKGVVNRLQELGAGTVEHLEGEPEDMVFALPKELRITLVN